MFLLVCIMRVPLRLFPVKKSYQKGLAVLKTCLRSKSPLLSMPVNVFYWYACVCGYTCANVAICHLHYLL